MDFGIACVARFRPGSAASAPTGNGRTIPVARAGSPAVIYRHHLQQRAASTTPYPSLNFDMGQPGREVWVALLGGFWQLTLTRVRCNKAMAAMASHNVTQQDCHPSRYAPSIVALNRNFGRTPINLCLTTASFAMLLVSQPEADVISSYLRQSISSCHQDRLIRLQPRVAGQ
ncbi:hypothetical protein LIA77_10299 [Sarocladium implicatum]|nr:hypothetical protein LIA77_10299 [Sarocladium implicatum]